MRRPHALAAAVVASVAAAALAPAAALAQSSSSFAQLTGTDACVVQALPSDYYFDEDTDYGKLCRDGHGLLQAEGVAVSPDQANVYVASAGTGRAGSNAVVAFAREAGTGALTEIGCISDDGGDGRIGSDGLCTDGDALGGANDVAVSPDGTSVYVSSGSSSGLAWFARDPATGALKQAGCFKDAPRTGDRCAGTTGLRGADGVTVSPDGRNVYVVAAQSDAVTAFVRDAQTGALTPAGCVSATGTDGLCTDGTALQGASAAAVSPDGAFVYVTARATGAISIYARAPQTGALTPAGCILDVAPKGGPCKAANALAGASSIVLSPDGDQAYVAASSGALLTFKRDAGTGALSQTACLQQADPVGDDAVYPDDSSGDTTDSTDSTGDSATGAQADPLAGCDGAKAIDGLEEIALSADGRSLFAASSGELTAFDRDPDTGALKQTACIQEDPTYKSCATAIGLYGASGLASSADGRNLYVASRNAHAVSVFGAAVAITTRATRVRGRVARVQLACPVARGPKGCAGRITLAGAARAYRVRAGGQRTFAVRVPAALRRSVRRHVARVTVRATDARRLTRPSARRVTLRR